MEKAPSSSSSSMVSSSSKVAPEIVADRGRSESSSGAGGPSSGAAEELLRLSRLQASQFGFDDDDLSLDDDDDGSRSRKEEKIYESHFKRGEIEAIRKVLRQMEVVALKRTSEGFNQNNFTLGVLNCFLIAYVIGDCPEHLWLLYLSESLYMIPRKFQNMWRAKPLNQAFYYLDFCWCMNFLGLFSLAALVIYDLLGSNVEEDARKPMFKAFMGVTCGVLLAANIALPFVACVFHDVNTMTGLFIHLMPPMVMYTFWWHSQEIVASWPKIFYFSYMDEIRYFGGMDSVAGCATFLYFMWFAFYVSFMLLVGINMPRTYEKNGKRADPTYDTVFHSTMRQGACIPIGRYFRGRSKSDSLKLMEENDFDTIDFFIYMTFHMIAALGAIYTVGYGCYRNQIFHKAMLGGSVVLAVVRGASRYTYYSTKMYAREIRKTFAAELEDDAGAKGEYSRMD